MPLINEVIRFGNTTGRVKNYYANGLIVIYDIRGNLSAGDTITCDDSGEVVVLNNFTISNDYDLYYEDFDLEWDDDRIVVQDNGEYVFQDAHYTGLPSQDYQTTNVVIQED
jgi:hypothetical protein